MISKIRFNHLTNYYKEQGLLSRLTRFLSLNSLVITLILSILIFITFFPEYFANSDEHCYLKNAYGISEGKLTTDNYGYAYKAIDYGNGYAANCMIGNSLLFAPFVQIDFHLAFVVIFVLFLIGVFYFHKILKLLTINPIFVLLYAFFPTIVLLSRTLFNEIPTTSFFIIGIYYFLKDFHERRNLILAGVFFGLSILTRYTQIIPISIFGSFMITELLYQNQHIKFKFKNLKKIIYFFIPLIISGVIILFFNKLLFGQPLKTGYIIDAGANSISSVMKNLLNYFIILNILYPGMLISSFLFKFKYKWLFLNASLTIIAFYSVMSLYPWGNSRVDLILGIRYLTPIIPLLLIIYSNVLDGFLDRARNLKLIKNLAIILITLSLLVSGLLINHYHQNELLYYRVETLKEINKYIPNGSIVIGEEDDFIYFMKEYNDKLYEDVEFIESLEDSKLSELITNNKQVYIINVTYPYRQNLKPQEEMIKFLERYKDIIKRVDSEDSYQWLKIYRLL